jgi:membrane protein YqaA with SNARE-associated domain
MRGLLDWLIAIGPAGVLFAAILDGAGLPIPGGVDALVIFLAARTPQSGWMFAAIAVLGSVIGNFFLFSLARRGGELYLRKRSSHPRSQRFRRWFDKYGLLTVFTSALVPLPVMPMKIFVICSGALGSPSLKFLAVFVAGRIPRYFGLAYLGMRMGDNALDYLKAHAIELTAIAVGLFLFLMFLVKLADKRHARLRAARPSGSEG